MDLGLLSLPVVCFLQGHISVWDSALFLPTHTSSGPASEPPATTTTSDTAAPSGSGFRGGRLLSSAGAGHFQQPTYLSTHPPVYLHTALIHPLHILYICLYTPHQLLPIHGLRDTYMFKSILHEYEHACVLQVLCSVSCSEELQLHQQVCQ